jgi:hypothetical protein
MTRISKHLGVKGSLILLGNDSQETDNLSPILVKIWNMSETANNDFIN